ncbi:MAG: AraC family transcriptional regulator [Acidimicrobiia bacterium]|nr:AraC family transcriptional regulator [Acidimicrobiia bacterium]
MADALTDILKSIRMEGSVFSRAALTAPWGVESGKTSSGMFHAVVNGSAWVTLVDDRSPIRLERGDVVMMPFGDNHLMTSEPGSETLPIAELNTVDQFGRGRLIVDGGGAPTSLICGTVSFDNGSAHPVLSMLPRLIHIREHGGRMASAVETMIGLIADEMDHPGAGTETVVARLTDALVVFVLRHYVETLSDSESSWLAALRDPPIREALGLIHRSPERAWTAAALSALVGMSRSAFFQRFRQTVGETPAQYLTRWRIHLATRLLREGEILVAGVAHQVGYTTEAAFSNAFKRVMGIRPGAYRRAA